VDAFFAPVAFRAQTYGLELEASAARYVATLLALDSMREWYAAGIQETRRDLAHDNDILAHGTVVADLRASPLLP
jgi:glutathione S-transferase